MDRKQQNEFEMPSTIFLPTRPATQNWPIVKIFDLWVFHPIMYGGKYDIKNKTSLVPTALLFY